MRWQIGGWVIDSDIDTVSDGATTQKLDRRAMEVLLYLAERAGKVVQKDELIADVWGRVAVSDHAVAMVVSQIRRTLRDDARTPTYIETITKRGYRLVARVEKLADDGGAIFEVAMPAADRQPAVLRRSSPALALAAALVLGVIAFSGVQRFAPATQSALPTEKPPFVIADFVNTTGLQQFDHIAYAYSFHLGIGLQQSEAEPIVRWRDDGSLRVDDVKRILGRNRVKLVSGFISKVDQRMMLRVKVRDSDPNSSVFSRDYAIDGRAIDTLVLAVSRDIAVESGRAIHDPIPGRPFPEEVHDLFWRAYFARNLGTAEAARQAHDTLRLLVDKYPDYVPAHQLLAMMFVEWPGAALGLPEVDTLSAARLQLDESKRLQGGVTGWTAYTEAWLSLYADRNSLAALDHAVRATRLNSSSALAWQTLARVASLSGKHDVALGALDKARRLDLANLSVISDRTWVLYAAGRFGEALEWAKRNERLVPTDHSLLALITHALNSNSEATTHWVAYLRERGVGDRRLHALANATASEAVAYRGFLNALNENERRSIEPIPLASLEMLANDRAAAVSTLQTVGAARDNWWNVRAHQVHLFAPLKVDRRLADIWLNGSPGERRTTHDGT